MLVIYFEKYIIQQKFLIKFSFIQSENGKCITESFSGCYLTQSERKKKKVKTLTAVTWKMWVIKITDLNEI